MDKDLQKKWQRYERKWRFRDFYFNKILRRHGILKYFHREPVICLLYTSDAADD